MWCDAKPCAALDTPLLAAPVHPILAMIVSSNSPSMPGMSGGWMGLPYQHAYSM